MAFSSSCAAPKVVMDSGTFCSVSARFVAVTVMASSVADPEVSSAAATVTLTAAANAAPKHATTPLRIRMLTTP